MTIHSVYGAFLPFFRRKRLRRFLARFRPEARTTILDLGGYPACWPVESCPGQITILNLSFHGEYRGPHTLIQGNACNLQFPDKSFDIGYSNSVIEHLHSFDNQKKFASEIRRVGRRIWVQTPARWFIVEPHLITPVIHYLPKAWQRRLLRYFTVWGLVSKPTRKQVDDFIDEVRLLTFREMQALFPDCQIYRERFLGMTKAYIAIR